MDKNWAHSVDQCWLQVWLHLIELLSILLRCNGFTRIQKAVGDQTSSRPLNRDHDLFGASLALGSALELLLHPPTEVAVTGCRIKFTFLSHVSI